MPVAWHFAGALGQIEGHQARPPVAVAVHDAAYPVACAASEALRYVAARADELRVLLYEPTSRRAVHALAPAEHVVAEVWHANDPEYTQQIAPTWVARAHGLPLTLTLADDPQRVVWCRNHGLAVREPSTIRALLLRLPALLADAPPRGKRGCAHVYFKPSQQRHDPSLAAVAALVQALRHNTPLELACFSWKHTHPGAAYIPWPSLEACAPLLADDAWNAVLHQCDPAWHMPPTLPAAATAAAAAAAAAASVVAADTTPRVALDAADAAADEVHRTASKDRPPVVEKPPVAPPTSVLDELEQGFVHLLEERNQAAESSEGWCNVCHAALHGERYKCLTCPDWDACTACHTNAATVHPGHKLVRLGAGNVVPKRPHPAQWVAHTHVTCNGCRQEIFGPRYKCSVCPEFDLCTACECDPTQAHRHEHGQEHVFVKLDTPKEAALWEKRNHTPLVQALEHAQAQTPGTPPQPEQEAPGAAAANVALGALSGLVSVGQAVLGNGALQESVPGVRTASLFAAALQTTDSGVPYVDMNRLADAIFHVVHPPPPMPTQAEHEPIDDDLVEFDAREEVGHTPDPAPPAAEDGSETAHAFDAEAAAAFDAGTFDAEAFQRAMDRALGAS